MLIVTLILPLVWYRHSYEKDVNKLVRVFGLRRKEALEDKIVHDDPYTYCYGIPPEIHPVLSAHDIYVTAVRCLLRVQSGCESTCCWE